MNKQTQTLINTFIVTAISYEKAMSALAAAYSGDKLSPADLRLGLAMALVHHKPSAYKGQFDKETGTTARDSALRKQVNRYASAIMGKCSSNDVGSVRVTAEQKAAYAAYSAAIEKAEARFTEVCGKDSAKVKKAMKARA